MEEISSRTAREDIVRPGLERRVAPLLLLRTMADDTSFPARPYYGKCHSISYLNSTRNHLTDASHRVAMFRGKYRGPSELSYRGHHRRSGLDTESLRTSESGTYTVDHLLVQYVQRNTPTAIHLVAAGNHAFLPRPTPQKDAEVNGPRGTTAASRPGRGDAAADGNRYVLRPPHVHLAVTHDQITVQPSPVVMTYGRSVFILVF
ncbi:hypothetical protein OH76DRAFT_433481 [Lentinus brumalis]|uniref:Uncharacterized protein n=1 Tax=Lentinus brumalis TaxID=2498619 RepID=A0A371DDN0_9APHY|nr:hypothetical protein OH76DRAFT_433481 [Polyporus brumalis]